MSRATPRTVTRSSGAKAGTDVPPGSRTRNGPATESKKISGPSAVSLICCTVPDASTQRNSECIAPGFIFTGTGGVVSASTEIFGARSPMNKRAPSSDFRNNSYSPATATSKNPSKTRPTKFSRVVTSSVTFDTTPTATGSKFAKSGRADHEPS